MLRETVIIPIGVDVLGFPEYVEHKIYQDKPSETKNEPKKRWLKVETKTIKQR